MAKLAGTPSPSDWERWETALERGAEPSTAAGELGLTCSAFKRQDAGRHGAALLASRVARGHFADKQAELWALAEGASDSMRIAWLKRWQPAFGGQRVEVTGAEGGPVEIQGGVALEAVVGVLAAVGVLEDGAGVARGALPAPPAVLPEPRDS